MMNFAGKAYFVAFVVFACALIAAGDFVYRRFFKRKEEAGKIEKKDSDQAINYAATWNEQPWKSAENKGEANEDSFTDKGFTDKSFTDKLEKMYEDAPRRSNLKRIIWTEQQKNREIAKELVKKEQDC